MAGHADRRLGVVGLAQVVPDLHPLRGPEVLLERREELAVDRLLAAALADELVLERVERVDVDRE